MRALITGAGIRLGRAIALALGSAGFDLALHHNRSAAPAQALADQLRATGRDVTLIQADLSTVEGCQQLIQAALAGPDIDVLVNNAALYEALPLEQITPEAWARMQDVNCRAPFLLTQGLLPMLRRSRLPGGGLVLNLADIGGERPVPGFVHYSVSKAGILMLTRALALELAPTVRVNAISPGTVLPPEDLSPEVAAAIQATIPAGRFGAAEDIAQAAVFLATGAPYITGQVLAVDGGRSVAGPMTAG